MDLGCLDLGCISISDKCSETNVDATEHVHSATKSGKSKSPKGTGQPTLNALNKFTTQIKKPSHRKNSPTNWFPRKKVDSYLKRKIKMLQEIDGMNLTLDETLGDSNPHYCRVLREKIAAREAARKAMEARKSALVEASWCKILKAARIQTKEAEELLVTAEKTAAEAFEEATALGLMMFDKPNKKSSKIETLMATTVTASFETAFDVDKEVAAAVKTAFIKFASCPSFDKEEFKELLNKISQNPKMEDHTSPEQSELSESEPELEIASQIDVSKPPRLQKTRKRQSFERLNMAKLVDLMLERLKCLKEEELSSLATIVATCGLNAVLAEEEKSGFNFPRRMSTVGSGMVESSNLDQDKTKQNDPELPGLDKFLVKHVTKLEKEVEEAKKNRKKPEHEDKKEDRVSVEKVLDLGSILVKHSSKLEKEIEEAKKNSRRSFKFSQKKLDLSEETPSLESVLIKHSSKLEKEVQEAKNRRNKGSESESESQKDGIFVTDKENIDKNLNRGKTENDQSLDKVLVKHVSRLERAKMEFKSNEERVKDKNTSSSNKQQMNEEGSLDQILVKHKSKLEREKLSFASTQQAEEEQNRNRNPVMSRREARERVLLEAWGGLGLGNSIKPHLSRLEGDKAAWIKAEEEERKKEFCR